MKTYLYSGLSLLSDGQSRFLDGAGLDEHLQADTSTGSISHLTDHLGSTSQLLDSTNGSAKARYDYKSYGRLEGDIDNPVASNAYTCTGREDDGTGLMYYRARYYDLELEVFISQDPLGDAQRYVGGNPLSFVDPLGLDYWVEGSVPGEGGHPFHQSFCVGNYIGKRSCNSFGLNARIKNNNPFNGSGYIYRDFSEPGKLSLVHL